jgi:hypothetical protein
MRLGGEDVVNCFPVVSFTTGAEPEGARPPMRECGVS